MEIISFIPEKLYYLESNDNIEDVVLDSSTHSKFISLDLDIDSSILTIKNALNSVLGKDVEYGNACLDFIDRKDENELLITSFLDVTLYYDYDVFNNIILVTGNEMNNIQEDILNNI